ncbi:SDR family NAD(P)-dependent oxidoreductase [Zavarzinia sp. CC-PAN008]|uniref:SDR family NAD(P)-dependent oxidoreductase n=1 Tax=Zavarzinia sp. CC-PAN008 TaxID=3243332 RepID=UPI003F74999A
MPAPDTLPALEPGRVAVITGAASGIGRAAAERFAGRGLHVVMADLAGERLDEASAAARAVAVGGAQVLPIATDMSDMNQVLALQSQVEGAFNDVGILMNNAGSGRNPGRSWENGDGWRALLATNLWGVINGVQAFVPGMLARGRPGLVVNTGSKQGITLPPGNSAYNLSKAGVKAFTETLAHELRNEPGARLSAHLLVPGWTHTGMTSRGGAKPAAAWTPEQVIDFMLASLGRGDFYILCPDNDVTRDMDEKRVRWTADDLIRNRPALSRWHPDHAEAFKAHMAEPGTGQG